MNRIRCRRASIKLPRLRGGARGRIGELGIPSRRRRSSFLSCAVSRRPGRTGEGNCRGGTKPYCCNTRFCCSSRAASNRARRSSSLFLFRSFKVWGLLILVYTATLYPLHTRSLTPPAALSPGSLGSGQNSLLGTSPLRLQSELIGHPVGEVRSLLLCPKQFSHHQSIVVPILSGVVSRQGFIFFFLQFLDQRIVSYLPGRLDLSTIRASGPFLNVL